MNKFDRFFRHRQSLLLQYKMGDLTKNEFIEENFHYIERLGIQPFTRLTISRKQSITITIIMSTQNTGSA